MALTPTRALIARLKAQDPQGYELAERAATLAVGAAERLGASDDRLRELRALALRLALGEEVQEPILRAAFTYWRTRDLAIAGEGLSTREREAMAEIAGLMQPVEAPQNM